MTKILLIEDAEDARNAIRRTLETHGFDVVTAGNGREGLAALEKTDVHVVLTDVFMPEMEGLETIRHLKDRHPGLPIIVMTGSLDDVYINMGVKLGATCALVKPFNTETLLQAIQTSLAKSGQAV